MSPWELPARIDQLVRELQIEAPVVVGHSLGGAVAMVSAAHVRTSGVVTIDQSPDVASMAPMARAIAPALDGPGFDQAWGMARQSIGRHLVAEPLRTQLLAEDEAKPEVIRAYWADLIADPEALQRRVNGDLARVTVPVLAVFGHQLEEVETTAVSAALPQADVQIEQWPGAGHCAHLVEPDRFARLLVDFVSRCAT